MYHQYFWQNKRTLKNWYRSWLVIHIELNLMNCWEIVMKESDKFLIFVFAPYRLPTVINYMLSCSHMTRRGNWKYRWLCAWTTTLLKQDWSWTITAGMTLTCVLLTASCKCSLMTNVFPSPIAVTLSHHLSSRGQKMLLLQLFWARATKAVSLKDPRCSSPPWTRTFSTTALFHWLATSVINFNC